MEQPVEKTINGVQISMIIGDITLQSTDAIVNAANSGLMGGGGVDGAIHRAGGPAILNECKDIISKQGRLPAGQSVITTGGQLPAKHVIHTVGPVWRGGSHEESETLANAYVSSLALAAQTGLLSISFPSISTGVYSYPVDQAADVALRAVRKFIQGTESTVNSVIFVLFDQKTYQAYVSAFNTVMR